MKKTLSLILTIVLMGTCLVPFTAFADDKIETDTNITQEEFESLEHAYAEYEQARATGLIIDKNLFIAKSN